jgi:LytS/YehU family sensor histidine kinase
MALSAIPLSGGALLFRFLRHVVLSKAEIGSLTIFNTHVHYHFSYFIIIFIIILITTNGTIHLMLDFVLVKNKNTRLDLENAELRIKNIEATYQQLRQQIHPHFLFNSLNTLKTLIDGNAEAEVFIKRLSDFLRASLTVNNKQTIVLDNELKLCIDYLELQKVRFREALLYSIDIPDEVRKGFVPVFAVQQLIENAIKHNVLTVNHPLHIKLEYEKGRIVVSNEMRLKNTTEESTGIGLINLIERYKILSGDEVIINTDNNCFSVSLKILNHEDSNHRG